MLFYFTEFFVAFRMEFYFNFYLPYLQFLNFFRMQNKKALFKYRAFLFKITLLNRNRLFRFQISEIIRWKFLPVQIVHFPFYKIFHKIFRKMKNKYCIPFLFLCFQIFQKNQTYLWWFYQFLLYRFCQQGKILLLLLRIRIPNHPWISRNFCIQNFQGLNLNFQISILNLRFFETFL